MWGLRHHRPAGLCPVDSRSFYVVGYFEETKLRHIREGAPARITLYSGAETLQGHVSSIGRAIYDQSVETDSGPVPDIKPNVPWVRLAQRVPVRVEFDQLPKDITGLWHNLHRRHRIAMMNTGALSAQYAVDKSDTAAVALRAA